MLVFEYYSVYIWGRFISDDVFSLPYIVSLLSGGRKSVIYLVVAYDLTPGGSAPQRRGTSFYRPGGTSFYRPGDILG